jgi:restriction endonuclease S subunit
MNKLKKYSTYKNSGVEWLGNIPEHWEVKKLKYLVNKILGGGTPESSNTKYWTDILNKSYLVCVVKPASFAFSITSSAFFSARFGCVASNVPK